MEINNFNIATPISNLFLKKDNADLISNYSDCLECRDHSILSTMPKQELFHCELQPIHKFGNKEIKYLEKIKLINFSKILNEDDYFIIDDHINVSGHQKVSDAILKIIQSELDTISEE